MRNYRLAYSLAIAFIAAILFANSPTWAVAKEQQVWIANTPILTVRAPAGDYSIAKRVNDLQLRFNNLFTFGRQIPKFSIMKFGDEVNIYADKDFLMTVTTADARANKTSAMRLAREWVSRLNRALPQAISLYTPSGVELPGIRIPKNAVVTATLDEPLSSTTSKVGDNFTAYQQGDQGPFPEDTKFIGRIESVVPASENTAGQIGVSFSVAVLLDGTSVPIDGRLISLDETSVMTSAASGRLVSTGRTGSDNRFIANGAGAGLAIGQAAVGDTPSVGAVLGADARYPYTQQELSPALGSDVTVPAGTSFGLLINETVTIKDATPGSIDLEK